MNEASSVLVKRVGKALVEDLFDAASLAKSTGWLPFRKGIEIMPLYGAPEDPASQAPSAALLRYGKGANVPPHEHTGYEHVMVLEGSQRDAQGTYRRGAFVISEPGSRHEVVSDDGCVVLVLWSLPVAFIQPEEP